jgi:peroxiredoxin Q/BCP
MTKTLVGKKCPSFEAECTSNMRLSNKDFIGKNLILYFYPKDSTPGCTSEGQDFRDRYKFPFELLSDPEEKVCKAFDVMKLKSMYGREYIGIDRSTFLINKNGKVIKEWRSVKINGHVQEVLDAVKEL